MCIRDSACDEDFARYVISKLDGLPPHQRQVVELRYFMDLSYQEIADELGIKLGTVKSRLNRAIEALRSMCPSDNLSLIHILETRQDPGRPHIRQSLRQLE